MKQEQLIYTSKNGLWGIGGLFLFLITMNYFILFSINKGYFFAGLLVLLILFYVVARKGISIFKLYEDRVEFYFPFSNTKLIIPNRSISLVSHTQSAAGNHDNIVMVNYRNERGELKAQPVLLSPSSNDEIIVLKHFQSKAVKLKVSSSKEKLLKALGL